MPKRAEPSRVHGSPRWKWAKDDRRWRWCPRCGSIHPIDLLNAVFEDRVVHLEARTVLLHEVDLRYDDVLVGAKFMAVHTMEPWLTEHQREELFRLLGWRFAWNDDDPSKLRAKLWTSIDES